MNGMDALVDSLLGLAASWEDTADSARANNGMFGAVAEEQDYRACAQQLREVLQKHKVGQWLP